MSPIFENGLEDKCLSVSILHLSVKRFHFWFTNYHSINYWAKCNPVTYVLVRWNALSLQNWTKVWVNLYELWNCTWSHWFTSYLVASYCVYRFRSNCFNQLKTFEDIAKKLKLQLFEFLRCKSFEWSCWIPKKALRIWIESSNLFFSWDLTPELQTGFRGKLMKEIELCVLVHSTFLHETLLVFDKN